MDLEWPPEQYRRELAMASQNSIVRSELNSSYEYVGYFGITSVGQAADSLVFRRLKAALRRCQKRDDIRHGIPELSNMQPCGCRAILCHIDRAMLSHGQRGRLLSNRVERMMSRAAPVAEQVLASMPDEICVLHGGLAVLFKVRG